MKVIIFFGFVICSLTSSAQEFNCSSSLNTAEQVYHMHGVFSADGQVEKIVLSLADKDDPSDHDVLKVDGPLQAAANFHPRSEKLKGFEKIVLEKNKLDNFFLFIPVSISGASFNAYVKIGFDGTYPSLQALSCSVK